MKLHSRGQRVQAKAGHPFAIYGVGTVQIQGFDDAFEVAFPVPDYMDSQQNASPVLRLWIQGKDLEIVTEDGIRPDTVVPGVGV